MGNGFITAAQGKLDSDLRLSRRHDTVDPESIAVIRIGGLADKCLISEGDTPELVS